MVLHEYLYAYSILQRVFISYIYQEDSWKFMAHHQSLWKWVKVALH